jgi:hypothetical protein
MRQCPPMRITLHRGRHHAGRDPPAAGRANRLRAGREAPAPRLTGSRPRMRASRNLVDHPWTIAGGGRAEFPLYGPVAQRSEQRTHNPKSAGSNPVRPIRRNPLLEQVSPWAPVPPRSVGATGRSPRPGLRRRSFHPRSDESHSTRSFSAGVSDQPTRARGSRLVVSLRPLSRNARAPASAAGCRPLSVQIPDQWM